MSSTSNFEKFTFPKFGEIAPKRFSVEAYHKMAELGIFDEDDRVELLEGVISPKMIHSPIHDAIVSVIEQVLRPLLHNQSILRIQSAITLEHSEPEPDLAVVQGPPLRYVDHHPGGKDVFLVIEVAESSVYRDRVKAAGYASAGIPVYWIVNLKQWQLEVFSSPHGNEYTKRVLLEPHDDAIVSSGFNGRKTINVGDLIPDSAAGEPQMPHE